jgi:hypothetical protein
VPAFNRVGIHSTAGRSTDRADALTKHLDRFDQNDLAQGAQRLSLVANAGPSRTYKSAKGRKRALNQVTSLEGTLGGAGRSLFRRRRPAQGQSSTDRGWLLVAARDRQLGQAEGTTCGLDKNETPPPEAVSTTLVDAT